MSRPIKFKAWHKPLKKMCYFDGPKFNEEYSLLCFKIVRDDDDEPHNLPGAYCGVGEPGGYRPEIDAEEPNNWEVMQFTGLHDKNGIEVYEGDILKPERYKEVSVVEWSELGSWVRRPVPNKKGAAFFMTDGQDGIDPDMKLHYQKVIGNLYQNPELLS